MSMASVTVKWQERDPCSSRLNPSITLQGRIHHSIGSFIPPGTLSPTYRSVYSHDTDLSKRCNIRAQSCDQTLPGPVLTSLAKMLKQHKSYAQSFLALRELDVWRAGTK